MGSNALSGLWRQLEYRAGGLRQHGIHARRRDGARGGIGRRTNRDVARRGAVMTRRTTQIRIHRSRVTHALQGCRRGHWRRTMTVGMLLPWGHVAEVHGQRWHGSVGGHGHGRRRRHLLLSIAVPMGRRRVTNRAKPLLHISIRLMHRHMLCMLLHMLLNMLRHILRWFEHWWRRRRTHFTNWRSNSLFTKLLHQISRQLDIERDAINRRIVQRRNAVERSMHAILLRRKMHKSISALTASACICGALLDRDILHTTEGHEDAMDVELGDALCAGRPIADMDGVHDTTARVLRCPTDPVDSECQRHWRSKAGQQGGESTQEHRSDARYPGCRFS